MRRSRVSINKPDKHCYQNILIWNFAYSRNCSTGILNKKLTQKKRKGKKIRK